MIEASVSSRMRDEVRTAGLHRGLRGQILDEIRREVISGQLAAGEQLVERRLASHFGVSHAPVREALLQLSQEGLLVAQPHAGVRVAPMASAEVRELLARLRCTLEACSLRRTVHLSAQLDWTVCGELIAKQRAAASRRDWPLVAVLDYRIHRWWIEHSDIVGVLPTWHALMARVRLFVGGPHVDQLDPNEFCDQHETLVGHVRRGEIDRAVEGLEANILAETASY